MAANNVGMTGIYDNLTLASRRTDLTARIDDLVLYIGAASPQMSYGSVTGAKDTLYDAEVNAGIVEAGLHALVKHIWVTTGHRALKRRDLIIFIVRSLGLSSGVQFDPNAYHIHC